MVSAMVGRGGRAAAWPSWARLGAPLFGALAAGSLLGCSSSNAHGSLPVDAAVIADATADAAADGSQEAAIDGSSGPNVVPGECVYSDSDNTWYCGAGYGTFPSCPGAGYPTLNTPCDFDGGYCLGCSQGAATSFSCEFGSYTIGARVGTECNH
jgi:hypothetical protein